MAPPLVNRNTDDVIVSDDHNDVKAYIEDGTYRIKTLRVESTIASGTAPIQCISSTLNTNLNADLLDGLHANELGTQTDLELLLYQASNGRFVNNLLGKWANMKFREDVSESTQISDSWRLHNLIFVNGYVYGGTVTPGEVTPQTAKIVKVDPDNMSIVTTSELTSENAEVPEIIYDSCAKKIYALTDTGKIYEIDPVTLESTLKFDCELTSQYHAITSDCNGSIYVVTWESPSRILKIDMNTWTLTQSTNLVNGVNSLANGHAIRCDRDYVYASGATENSWVVKALCSDVTDYDVAICTGITTFTNTLAMIGDYLYLSPEATRKLVVMKKSDLSFISFPVSDYLGGAFYDGTHLWLISNEHPKAIRFDPIKLESASFNLNLAVGTWAWGAVSDGE